MCVYKTLTEFDFVVDATSLGNVTQYVKPEVRAELSSMLPSNAYLHKEEGSDNVLVLRSYGNSFLDFITHTIDACTKFSAHTNYSNKQIIDKLKELLTFDDCLVATSLSAFYYKNTFMQQLNMHWNEETQDLLTNFDGKGLVDTLRCFCRNQESLRLSKESLQNNIEYAIRNLCRLYVEGSVFPIINYAEPYEVYKNAPVSQFTLLVCNKLICNLAAHIKMESDFYTIIQDKALLSVIETLLPKYSSSIGDVAYPLIAVYSEVATTINKMYGDIYLDGPMSFVNSVTLNPKYPVKLWMLNADDCREASFRFIKTLLSQYCDVFDNKYENDLKYGNAINTNCNSSVLLPYLASIVNPQAGSFSFNTMETTVKAWFSSAENSVKEFSVSAVQANLFYKFILNPVDLLDTFDVLPKHVCVYLKKLKKECNGSVETLLAMLDQVNKDLLNFLVSPNLLCSVDSVDYTLNVYEPAYRKPYVNYGECLNDNVKQG